jgi:hypothetical protein
MSGGRLLQHLAQVRSHDALKRALHVRIPVSGSGISILAGQGMALGRRHRCLRGLCLLRGQGQSRGKCQTGQQACCRKTFSGKPAAQAGHAFDL